MTKELLKQLFEDIDRENIRFGFVEVIFTFHDGRPTNYELTVHRRRNIGMLTSKKTSTCKEGEND